MSGVQDSYRSTGLIIVALAIFLIAVDLAVFTLCDGGQATCFSWETNRVSDLSLLVFFGLFLVGIAILAWPVEPAGPAVEPRPGPGTAPTPSPPASPPPGAFPEPTPSPAVPARSRRSYPEAAAGAPARPEGEALRP